MSTRWVLEGEWSGYHAGQHKVVHRQVFAGRPKLRAVLTKIGGIRFTDGTNLVLYIREAKPRERVAEIHGYTSLIRDCAHYGVSSVANLEQAIAAVRAGVRADDARVAL